MKIVLCCLLALAVAGCTGQKIKKATDWCMAGPAPGARYDVSNAVKAQAQCAHCCRTRLPLEGVKGDGTGTLAHGSCTCSVK